MSERGNTKKKGRFWKSPDEAAQEDIGIESEIAAQPLREFKIPIILLGIGLVCLIISAFTLGGAVETLTILLAAALVLLVQIPVTILAMYILSSLLGIAYGNLFSGILKLAAITIFLEGLTFAGTLLGHEIASRIVLLPVAWFLFSYLFELDFTETFYSILGLGFVSGGINWLIILLTGDLSKVPT